MDDNIDHLVTLSSSCIEWSSVIRLVTFLELRHTPTEEEALMDLYGSRITMGVLTYRQLMRAIANERNIKAIMSPEVRVFPM